jgi:hypothetical protein
MSRSASLLQGTIRLVRAQQQLALQTTTLINLLEGTDMATEAQLIASLDANTAKTQKIVAEVTAATAQMAAALAAAGNTTPAVDEAMARLDAALTVADDLNPDAPGVAPDGGIVAP